MISTNEAARYEAQRLAFAPLLFQACRVLRDSGLLEALVKRRKHGLTVSEALERCPTLNPYAASMLLEAGLAAGLCGWADALPEPRFFSTPVGVYWLRDPLTRVNAEFTHHVCYEGAQSLRQALLEGFPAGLPRIDRTGADTVYRALRTLDPEVRQAWFDFDHYHSDEVFELALRDVGLSKVEHLVDVGGNTGRFARLVLGQSQTRVTIVDLPEQLAVAKDELAPFGARFTGHPVDLLDPKAALPRGADVYWMSQFLDCFGEDEIRSILTRVREAMRPDSRLFILETFWNRQRHEGARLSVIATSLYFACIANGTSRMYHSEVISRLAREAGLLPAAELRDLGLAHTLMTLRR